MYTAGLIIARGALVPITDDRPKSAVVGVAIRNGRFLTVQRSQHVIAPGQFCFCGGMCEAGEAEDVAIRREFLEELGLQVEPRNAHWKSVTPWGIRVSWWTVHVPLGETVAMDPREVADCGWYSLQELDKLSPLLESNRQWLEAYQQGKFQLPKDT